MENSSETGVLRSTVEFLSTHLNNLTNGRFGHLADSSRSNMTPTTTSACCRGYRATYLGKETANCGVVGTSAQTFDCIERLLQRIANNTNTSNDISCNSEIYIDVLRCKCITVYEVNAWQRVTSNTRFDLTRVAFCTGGEHPAYDQCLLAWLYRQETPTGFQLDCHVVRLSSRGKARRLAAHIGASFHQAYADVRAATEIGCRLATTGSRWSTSRSSCPSKCNTENSNLSIAIDDTQGPLEKRSESKDNKNICKIAVYPTSSCNGMSSNSDDDLSCNTCLDDDVFMVHDEI